MAVVAFGVCHASLPAHETAQRRVQIGRERVAAMSASYQLYLEAKPGRGEGMLAFAHRFCGDTDAAAAIAETNGGVERLLVGVRYRIPFASLTDDYQLQVITNLFAEDRAVSGGWQHKVGPGIGDSRESLWHLAEWFTGQAENFRVIRHANGLPDDDLAPGQVVLIPAALLRPGLRATLPPTSPYDLEFGRDKGGEYAIYRLEAGEALYSSVVVRFTGRVYADDVNALATEVAQRSGIKDVTDIPVAFGVKVPLSLLLPEYLPAGHPRRSEYEEGLLASSRFSNQVRASRLQGVTLILDPGHGGEDVGASLAGVWESLYVYDIMVRVKTLLETTTAAHVIATTMDGREHRIADHNRLPYSKNHRVLTTPNYRIEDSRVGVHLRWYLANSIFRQAIELGSEPSKVVFLSVHADSLHPSLRGAMVYIPGAKYRRGSYGKRGTVYASRREFQERPKVSFASRELVESEGLSRDLGGHVLQALASSGLEIHPYKPIRERIIRNKRSWVPAVLRYNAVPAKILLEVCNLANREDRELIQTQAFRQQVAEAIVQGILGYYDGQPSGTTVAVATTSG